MERRLGSRWVGGWEGGKGETIIKIHQIRRQRFSVGKLMAQQAPLPMTEKPWKWTTEGHSAALSL